MYIPKNIPQRVQTTAQPSRPAVNPGIVGGSVAMPPQLANPNPNPNPNLGLKRINPNVNVNLPPVNFNPNLGNQKINPNLSRPGAVTLPRQRPPAPPTLYPMEQPVLPPQTVSYPYK